MTQRVSLILALLLPWVWVSPAQAFGSCMPIYGNWCGPGHPAVGAYPPPMDGFDAVCMRHDFCTLAAYDDTGCDIAFVEELRGLAMQYGGLPRALQWAEYVIRIKAGGNWGDMPTPTPWDAWSAMDSYATPCW